MQIKINELTITDLFRMSQLVKEKCKGLSSLEEVAQELMNTFCRAFITGSGKSTFVLSRFLKSCTYVDLPEEIKIYIQRQEGKEKIYAKNRYLTLLGTSGDLEEWKCRKDSKGHQALPLYDPLTIYNIPMLSALLNQIGFEISDTSEPGKNIIIDKEEHDFGIFCVEDAGGSKLIPQQAEFVEPFGIKSVIGWGGCYKTGHIYAIIIFSREKISKGVAKLFLSLNPGVKQITLRHEMAGNIFKKSGSNGYD
tara:strand:- start:221 stop:973 length:753 start_codon:yes stop_codon:yes gene_type:complete